VKKANGRPKRTRPGPAAIAKVIVAGYKSLKDAAEVEIRPLTLLAGANSSGKSSVMQPLLLMKQTLEAPHDPGGLKLDGPHVKLTDAEQMFWRGGHRRDRRQLRAGGRIARGSGLRARRDAIEADCTSERRPPLYASCDDELEGD
jgi:hypothetical protein